MDRVQKKRLELKEKDAQVLAMGGASAVEKHKAKGKLTARERLECLFDKDTFREIDRFVTHRCTTFGMDQMEIPADGVITGHGLINGRPVFAYAQDVTSRAGSLGEMHAQKICKIMDMALKAGVPIIGMNDSGGARIQEGVAALAGYGEIFSGGEVCHLESRLPTPVYQAHSFTSGKRLGRRRHPRLPHGGRPQQTRRPTGLGVVEAAIQRMASP